MTRMSSLISYINEKLPEDDQTVIAVTYMLEIMARIQQLFKETGEMWTPEEVAAAAREIRQQAMSDDT